MVDRKFDGRTGGGAAVREWKRKRKGTKRNRNTQANRISTETLLPSLVATQINWLHTSHEAQSAAAAMNFALVSFAFRSTHPSTSYPSAKIVTVQRLLCEGLMAGLVSLRFRLISVRRVGRLVAVLLPAMRSVRRCCAAAAGRVVRRSHFSPLHPLPPPPPLCRPLPATDSRPHRHSTPSCKQAHWRCTRI